ncbi:acetyl-CoA C-acyltransferase [Asticcacaulis taihuensis]|uniref:Acetyl-CoA C-acetyltransferase n=1 Tax=Asticcacaulis taihuensis TaxID=260084 RepID=A0A1G4QU26_9CAUL|nr:acetyl-CoA C-acyltransferase [Asticcacaulis taihuensis]SCW47878.1 acetyl-CoA C-acetyltransferase [Asticcacaulis taihuensis]
MPETIIIAGAARTPMGGFQGDFAAVTAPELGAAAIRAVLNGQVPDEVIMGCVLPAGQGQAPARQAALGAGLPVSVPATTVNKMCGSGMKAVMLACDAIAAGSAGMVVAGGMESMSNAPYLLPKARAGMRMGHGEVKDHMFLDGLEDAYDKGRLMGSFADEAATHYQFTRQMQDDYALASLDRALKADFSAEITPVETKAGLITADEQPAKARPEKIPTLKPAFTKDGTVTAANSSSISDGAAALLLARASMAEARGLAPIARIVGHASHAEEPKWFSRAPVGAVRKLLDKIGWGIGDVDLFEVNEAFAVVALIAMHDLGIPHDKLNVHGGACALGHPIGASGARILVTLINALKQRGLKRGVAAVCIGGGEATAVAVEIV